MESETYWLFGVGFVFSFGAIVFLNLAKTVLQSLDENDIEALHSGSTGTISRIQNIISNWPEVCMSFRYGFFVGLLIVLFSVIGLSEYAAQTFSVSFTLASFIGFSVIALLIILSDIIIEPLLYKHRQKLAVIVLLPTTWYVALSKPFIQLKVYVRTLIFKDRDCEFGQLHRSYHVFRGIDGGEHIGILDENEREMIHSIFEFGETEVHEIMVPRTDIISADEESTVDDVTQLMKEKGHSRLPLYREDIDHILGIVHIKDLMPFVLSETPTSLVDVARTAHFVPETKKLDQLLKEFQREKHHMAIVVDEYGGTAGLVTLEDVLEEIVGDIQDEYDTEAPLYHKIDESAYWVDAKIDLNELNEELKLNLPTEGEYDSLGGFILSLTGYVPAQNELVEYENIKFIVDKMTANRIIRVKLVRHEKESQDLTDSKSE